VEDEYLDIKISSGYSLKMIIDKLREKAKKSNEFRKFTDKPLEDLLPIIKIHIRTCGCCADVYLSEERK